LPSDHTQVDENNIPTSEFTERKRPLESLVGSAFDLLQYLAFPVSLSQLKCVAIWLALKRHPPFTNTVRCLIFAERVACKAAFAAEISFGPHLFSNIKGPDYGTQRAEL
jgi:hypothetical protein